MKDRAAGGSVTLVEMLEKNAREIPEKAAIIFRGITENYRELNETVNRLVHFLLKDGLGKGDRVGLMLPRIPELVRAFLAVAKAGGVAVPINFELLDKNIESILNNISPRHVIVHAPYLGLLRRALPSASSARIITVGGADRGCLSWNEAVSAGKADNPGLEINDNDVVYLNYTSGSTGNFKGAITTHLNIYYNTIASVDALQMTADDIHLCMFAPFAHPHEIFARPLYLGGTMVLVDTIYPKSLAEAISTYKVTCVMGLSPMYENLLELLEHKFYDLSSMRIAESGGMYTRPELIQRFRRKIGVPILPVWGSTETTGIALSNRPGTDMPPGSVGKPCLSYKVKVVDDNGNELPPGEIGEMIFKGPAVVQSYYNSANGSKAFKDNWYYSDDLGRMDATGNFYFVDRKTSMMKVAGLKVYPLEIEKALMEHPAIKEAAVIPARDRLRGEVPKAVIVLKEGNKSTEKAILEFCKERLPNYKLPRIVEIRESLPKTGSGKINKKLLEMEENESTGG